MSYLSKVLGLLFSLGSMSVWAQGDVECKRQIIENSTVEMCLQRGEPFQHDTYILKADGVLVFALVDDYAEKVELAHTIPPGLTMELPLSKQGINPIKITGGCVPEIKDELEIARMCNFYWGKWQVVKDVRFEFK